METRGGAPEAAPSDLTVGPLLQPGEITADSLRSLIGAVERSGARFVDWQRLGRPGIDRVVVVAEGPSTQAGALVQGVLGVDALRAQIRVFPRGIPRPDLMRVEIEVDSAPR